MAGGGGGTGQPGPRPFSGGVLVPVWGWGLRACPGPDLCLAARLGGAGGGADFLSLPASRRDDNNESEREVGRGARPGFFGPFALWPWVSPLPQASVALLFRGSGEAIPRPQGWKGWAFAAAASAGSGTSQTALVSNQASPNPGLRPPPPPASPSSRPRKPALLKGAASSGSPEPRRFLWGSPNTEQSGSLHTRRSDPRWGLALLPQQPRGRRRPVLDGVKQSSGDGAAHTPERGPRAERRDP